MKPIIKKLISNGNYALSALSLLGGAYSLITGKSFLLARNSYMGSVDGHYAYILGASYVLLSIALLLFAINEEEDDYNIKYYGGGLFLALFLFGYTYTTYNVFMYG
jgi:hypothetical protein